MRESVLLAVRLGLVGLIAGCGGSGSNSVVVTAVEFGDAWPLTVSDAKLYCNAMGERYLAVDGVTYALNGKALQAGMQRPDAVVKEGAVASVLTERAGALCGSSS